MLSNAQETMIRTAFQSGAPIKPINEALVAPGVFTCRRSDAITVVTATTARIQEVFLLIILFMTSLSEGTYIGLSSLSRLVKENFVLLYSLRIRNSNTPITIAVSVLPIETRTSRSTRLAKTRLIFFFFANRIKKAKSNKALNVK
jgi:hypothetical protein